MVLVKVRLLNAAVIQSAQPLIAQSNSVNVRLPLNRADIRLGCEWG